MLPELAYIVGLQPPVAFNRMGMIPNETHGIRSKKGVGLFG